MAQAINWVAKLLQSLIQLIFSTGGSPENLRASGGTGAEPTTQAGQPDPTRIEPGSNNPDPAPHNPNHLLTTAEGRQLERSQLEAARANLLHPDATPGEIREEETIRPTDSEIASIRARIEINERLLRQEEPRDPQQELLFQMVERHWKDLYEGRSLAEVAEIIAQRITAAAAEPTLDSNQPSPSRIPRDDRGLRSLLDQLGHNGSSETGSSNPDTSLVPRGGPYS